MGCVGRGEFMRRRIPMPQTLITDLTSDAETDAGNLVMSYPEQG